MECQKMVNIVASLELQNDRNMSLSITKNRCGFYRLVIGYCLHIEYCIFIECSAFMAILQVRVCTFRYCQAKIEYPDISDDP